METKTLYILRGVSGAGKTTLARDLERFLPNSISMSADWYFYSIKDGYNFDSKLLPKAHQFCKDIVKSRMEDGLANIIVHNTNTSEKEINPYLKLAEEYGYKVVSLVVENRADSKSVHNVPEKTLQSQESRLKGSLKLR